MRRGDGSGEAGPHSVRGVRVRNMRKYKLGTIVRLTKKQPIGSTLLEKYPDMRGEVVWATLGMTRVRWSPKGAEPAVFVHYNTEIVRCNKNHLGADERDAFEQFYQSIHPKYKPTDDGVCVRAAWLVWRGACAWQRGLALGAPNEPHKTKPR